MTELLAALRRRGVTDASDSTLDRALYATDASLYRVVPAAVARPRSTEEVLAALEACREVGVPITARGAGTSIAGNAVGPGLVLDTRRHLDRILALDPEARTVTVEPGVVHAQVQAAAQQHGLRLGPDPSTHTRCTVGGMIGNNACGSRALAWGRTSDNVVSVESTLTGEAADGLAALAERHLAHIRTSFGQFSRQVSGYALEHLLPEQRSVDRFLAGSEGTLALITSATLALVPDEPRSLCVLGFPSMADAADVVPQLLGAGLRLFACEGLDARMIDVVRRRGDAVPELPRGDGWLFVETAPGERVPSLGELARRDDVPPAEAAALWRIREAGAGLASRSLSRPAWAGWEDAAVPPAALGAWLRDFEGLLTEHGLDTVPYGHFGDGCVHARIDFDFTDPSGRERFRDFLVASATRLREYGGSLSGEHGDGRARSELLPLMYDDTSMRLFAEVKRICDPDALLNPGVLVDPAAVTDDLWPATPRARLPLRLSADVDLADGVERCTGVGSCVAPHARGVMCPSYLATRDEKDSTRGRARVLQQALEGGLVDGLDDPAVGEALDLCLSCKGCVSDCPTGVDMAAYKAEVLHRTYDGKRRPLSHYTLGRLPRWLRHTPTWAYRFAGLGKRVAGVDARRSLPALDRMAAPSAPEDTPDVWLWGDSFTQNFGGSAARATLEYLEHAGVRAAVIPVDACCALTWISTGQLAAAERIIRKSAARLAPYLDTPIVALEPSCLATWRDDAGRLAGEQAGAVGRNLRTLAELITERELPVPSLAGVEVVAQPHCHHASVLGWEADEALLRDAGATVTRVPGCCGLAGDFGMTHYDVSLQVAETALLPAVRSHPDAVVLADGLSCRHQLADLAGVRARHLGELLASRIGV
jgi:FAD/FMN-containing dehydrogenase/Fe-S oxidoreductase